jgi:hypothetical protein
MNEAHGSMGLIEFGFDMWKLRVLFRIEFRHEPAAFFGSKRRLGISELKRRKGGA